MEFTIMNNDDTKNKSTKPLLPVNGGDNDPVMQKVQQLMDIAATATKMKNIDGMQIGIYTQDDKKYVSVLLPIATNVFAFHSPQSAREMAEKLIDTANLLENGMLESIIKEDISDADT